MNKFRARIGDEFESEAAWNECLDSAHIRGERQCRIATEGALLGSLLKHGVCSDLVIVSVSDGVQQFDILLHGLCWIHTERLVHKKPPLNETHRQEIAHVRGQIWQLYTDLRAFTIAPEDQGTAAALAERFDKIFTHKTGFETLSQLFKRIHSN